MNNQQLKLGFGTIVSDGEKYAKAVRDEDKLVVYLDMRTASNVTPGSNRPRLELALGPCLPALPKKGDRIVFAIVEDAKPRPSEDGKRMIAPKVAFWAYETWWLKALAEMRGDEVAAPKAPDKQDPVALPMPELVGEAVCIAHNTKHAFGTTCPDCDSGKPEIYWGAERQDNPAPQPTSRYLQCEKHSTWFKEEWECPHCAADESQTQPVTAPVAKIFHCLKGHGYWTGGECKFCSGELEPDHSPMRYSKSLAISAYCEKHDATYPRALGCSECSGGERGIWTEEPQELTAPSAPAPEDVDAQEEKFVLCPKHGYYWYEDGCRDCYDEAKTPKKKKKNSNRQKEAEKKQDRKQ